MLNPLGTLLVQAPISRDGISVAADLAVIVVSLALVVVALFSGFLILRILGMLRELRLSLRQNLGPVSDRARSISDNVEFITQAVRTDVERLNDSVKSLSDRLQLASDRMEERIEEFNALMRVVQDEAEGIFLDTASTMRGMQRGARSFTDPSLPDEEVFEATERMVDEETATGVDQT